MKKIDIWVDMDGVLVDFVGSVGDFPGWENGDVSDLSAFWGHIQSLGFDWWAGLPWTEDGEQLWAWLQSLPRDAVAVRILSAAPDTGYVEGVGGKNKWIADNIGAGWAHMAVITRRENKKHLARETSLLIDDYGKNIKEWESAGGIGVKHENTEDTIRALKALLHVG